MLITPSIVAERAVRGGGAPGWCRRGGDVGSQAGHGAWQGGGVVRRPLLSTVVLALVTGVAASVVLFAPGRHVTGSPTPHCAAVEVLFDSDERMGRAAEELRGDRRVREVRDERTQAQNHERLTAALREAGAEVVVVGPAAGAVYQGMHGVSVSAELAAGRARMKDFDALVIPGGHAPDRMRLRHAMVDLAREECHGSIVGRRIAILGAAFKPDSDDVRDSPALAVAKMLHEAGNITDLELHQEQLIYEEQKLNLAEAERDAVELREELNMLMGLWGACTQWKISAELPDMPKREFQGRGLESIAV